uniref:Putative LAGLIDADG homing endonuclease n=1 Tax=Monomastix sp. (strain OKE-1) TaxID=141716 RepID=U5YDY3_MONSK|nr:putative LAGLIDADG homing endonuclease [Monomastix sp. OKE-1]AGZ90188.1 putative LAGLIDADG homing endonuclease [Monomastix sp. OKE-1]
MSTSQFPFYLAGLIEGDGHFYSPARHRTNKGNTLYPSIQICFALKDLPLAQMVLAHLGHGSLCRTSGKQAYILTVIDREGCVALVHMINGKLRTSKCHQFSRFLTCLNERGYGNFVVGPKDTSPVFSNAWLAGFIEAAGCFEIRCTLTPPRRISPSFVIEQAYSHEEDRPLFTTISKSFLAPEPRIIQRKGKGEFWRIRTTSLAGNLCLLQYLKECSLAGAKYMDFRDWCQVVEMVREKKHLMDASFPIVLAIKKDFNDARTTFDWTHLKTFF